MISARLTDRRALDRLGGEYFYNRQDLASQWDAFAKYRSEGQLAELGEPQITSYDISLSGGKTDEPAHSCEIRSPGSTSTQAEPAKDGATTIATGKCRRPVGSTTTRSTAPSSAS